MMTDAAIDMPSFAKCLDAYGVALSPYPLSSRMRTEMFGGLEAACRLSSTRATTYAFGVAFQLWWHLPIADAYRTEQHLPLYGESFYTRQDFAVEETLRTVSTHDHLSPLSARIVAALPRGLNAMWDASEHHGERMTNHEWALMLDDVLSHLALRLTYASPTVAPLVVSMTHAEWRRRATTEEVSAAQRDVQTYDTILSIGKHD